MFITSVISKSCFRNHSFAKRGLSVILNEFKLPKFKSIHISSCTYKTVKVWPCNRLSVCKPSTVWKYLSFRCSSVQRVTVTKDENHIPVKSSFQEMLNTRKMQAHRSVLVEVSEKGDIPFAIAYFEKYGTIANAYSYSGENKNCFMLLEFSTEMSVQKLISNCGFQNIDDVFPVHSRIIQYEKKPNAKLPEVNISVNEENNSEPSFKPGSSISQVIEDMYSTEKLTELDIRLRFFLCSLMKDSVSGLFPHCDILPFGSSVNGVGKQGSDLDLVIRLYPDKKNGDGEVFFSSKTCVGRHKNLQQTALSRLGHYFLFFPGAVLIDKIMFARVPILKMKHTILNIDFDVSVNNMSAVLMSDMLHFCGEIDPRVRPLVNIVKKWAKESNITIEAPGCQISNFGLTNLVLYFLQTRNPQPILPPLKDALTIIGSDNSYNFRLQYLKSIEDWRAKASFNKESLAVLLREFLSFLSTYPFHEVIISLFSGGSRIRQDDSTPLYLEYPLDESLNITRNVSKAEYDVMCEKAKVSARFLDKSLQQTVCTVNDFYVLLGIPSVSRIGTRPAKFNVNAKFNGNSVIKNENKLKNRNVRYKVA